VKAGADVIKIMITGGVGTEGSDPMMAEFSDGEIIAAIEEAHRCNRKIAAHAHGGPAIKCAVQNGMDSIEHGVYLTEDEIKLMSEKGTYLVVTYGILSAASKLPHIPEFMRKKAEETLEHYPKTISLAKKHGLNVVFGGDTYHADPKAELEALVDAGFSPEDALKAGTVNAAKLLGMEDKVGSISIGKFADLIVLKGDPSKNIQDIANIICVIKDGHVYYSNKPKD
jgi:imidazolonepropionase-like amidohydrolase